MSAEPRLAPVGHYHGVVQTTVDVRLDTQTVHLDDAEHAVWLLAHGTGEHGPALLTASELGALSDAPDVVARLLARGLLAEVPGDPSGYPAFAAAYRLVPLVYGLGNVRDGTPWHLRIGLPAGSGPLAGAWASLSELGYEIWRWSAATRSLAEVCAALEVPQDTAVGHAVETLPALLTGWTTALQPAAVSALVPGPRDAGPPLAPPEPVDPFTALDPEEELSVPWDPARPDGPVMAVPRWEADPGHPGAAGWVFAVGHDAGPRFDWTDGSYRGNAVRIGSDDHRADEHDARLWELARTGHRGQLWTRSAVAAAAVGDGVPDAPRRLDGLIERGLVVEVHPGTPRAVAFARAYRLQPLLHGLGTTADDPKIFEYGTPGRRVRSSTTHSSLFWRTAGQWPSLWDAITALSGSFAGAGQTGHRQGDPEEYLTYWGFRIVRELLAKGVVYLDLTP